MLAQERMQCRWLHPWSVWLRPGARGGHGASVPDPRSTATSVAIERKERLFGGWNAVRGVLVRRASAKRRVGTWRPASCRGPHRIAAERAASALAARSEGIRPLRPGREGRAPGPGPPCFGAEDRVAPASAGSAQHESRCGADRSSECSAREVTTVGPGRNCNDEERACGSPRACDPSARRRTATGHCGDTLEWCRRTGKAIGRLLATDGSDERPKDLKADS